MGANMAKNLAAANHKLVLFDTNPQAYEGFEGHEVRYSINLYGIATNCPGILNCN